MADASTSFFTFDPPLVLADMQNAVDDYIADASDAIETALLAECNPSGDAALAKEISEGTDALNSQLVDKFGEKFGVLVEYVKRNIFAVDEEIAVAAAEEANASAAAAAGGGGDGDVAPVTEEDEKETNKQLKDVKLRLAKARQEEVTLKSRQRQIEALEKLFETHREEIEQIKVSQYLLKSRHQTFPSDQRFVEHVFWWGFLAVMLCEGFHSSLLVFAVGVWIRGQGESKVCAADGGCGEAEEHPERDHSGSGRAGQDKCKRLGRASKAMTA